MNEAARKVIAHAIQRANTEITLLEEDTAELEREAQSRRDRIDELIKQCEDLNASLDEYEATHPTG